MTVIRRLANLALAVIALCAIAVPVSAQITTGTISGSVKDMQGAIVPGATVTLVAARGTTGDVQTDGEGNFVFPNISPGTYTIRVTMDGFKTLERPGISVSPGDRVLVQTLSIELGALSETVTVHAEPPLIQASSGERSFTIATSAVENLPIANRSFTALTSLAPGVSGNNRIGGGGGNNIMIDGVSAVDTGSNAILLQMNVESIAEVRVLVSNYQAEYGRSSGLQVTAVTKSGTNQFRGSIYDVERNSDWNSNSRTNILNGDPKTVSRQRDWGYAIGGPVGKPGGNNKLFFFYSHEFAPRTAGNDVQRYRMPTALERAGDFSQTLDNNGNLFNLIRDGLTGLPCSATDQRGCFADGGRLGRIPTNRLYQTGVNILNLYPLPNLPTTPGVLYNYEITRPTETALAWQPAIRVDYQPLRTLRTTLKYSGWQQRKQTFNGSIPGFNDTRMQNPIVSTYAITGNYNLNATTFIEATYGHSQNELAGCGLAQGGTGPTFCQNAIPMNPVSNRQTAGLAGLPMLFPNALVLNPDYYAYRVLENVQPPFWVNGQLLRTPNFTWGNRVSSNTPNYAPPNIPFAGFLNKNATDDVSISLTKVWRRHTMKGGFYNTHSYKAQQQNSAATFGQLTFSNDTSNPIDAQFGYANAILGVFSAYNQLSQYIEGSYVYNNTEGYIQDNWKVNNRLTLDYGVRFVHQQPQYDELGQAANFFPEEWTLSQAPVLYVAGCANGVFPCSGINRQAMNPSTGQFLGSNSTVLIGALVPNSGNTTNGLHLSGQGIAKTTYTWPALGVAPRFGMAYDLTGQQKFVLRGGAGLYFDRPSGNSIYAQVTNPPTVRNVTVRYAQLQTLGSAGLTVEAPPALSVFQYKSGLPSSTQWAGGLQMTLPWAIALDVEYVGQHSWNTPQGVNLNAIDFGAAFLPENQDRTLAASATSGAAALNTEHMRAFRGYGAINQQWLRGWRTFHSVQLSFNRRFRDGFSFGFNDTISLYDHQNTGARLQHSADGTYSLRADQEEANKLLGTVVSNYHTLKANFVWDLPDIQARRPALRALGFVANDWQLSGIWTASTGSPYTIGANYQGGATGNGNQNITGSPDYGGRVRIVGDPGSGCSGDVYQQFNAVAFQGPLVGSDGLESGADYLRGCFQSVLDLAIARNIRLGRSRQLQLRVDLFNAPNAAIITNRNTTMNLPNPNDPLTVVNLPFANGTLVAARSRPRGAGFGVATDYQTARSVQLQVRFSF